MLKKIKILFESFATPVGDEPVNEKRVQFAASVLMFEAIMADHEMTLSEMEQFISQLRQLFHLDQEQSEDLLMLAEHGHEELVSIHEMTKIINHTKDQELKKKIVKAMWCIAFADKNKHKYEEHLIRKVADLLHLSHQDFIMAKLRAEAGICLS